MGKIGHGAEKVSPDHRLSPHQCPLQTGFTVLFTEISDKPENTDVRKIIVVHEFVYCLKQVPPC